MTPTPPALPHRIAGRYLVERELGRGGSAIVYLAHDEQRSEPVALKVLRSEVHETVSTSRFLREIRITQELAHPHIAPVLDSGLSEGAVYCALQYLEGGSLRARLDRERQLPMADVLVIADAVAGALSYAHEHGVIHRDVKPENILFSAGVVYLADFGIARALESAGDTTTSTGVVRGTPAYMSPEQASGEREYDGRSDVYSLACVLYEAISGMPAFVGPNAQAVLAQRLVHVPRSLQVYRPTVTDEVDAILARALAIAPADRFQSAAEFAAAFREAMQAGVDPSRRRITGGRTPRRAWQRPVWWTAVVAIASLGALAIGPMRRGILGLPEVGRDTLSASAGATQAWHRGVAALELWDLRQADSAFVRASELDSGFARSQLWLAVVRAWSGAAQGLRTLALENAMRNPAHLTTREWHIGLALRDEQRGAFARACPAWRTLAMADTRDYVSWLGLASCLRQDDAVIPDPASPSGWRFRTSANEMVAAYRRALEHHPPGRESRASEWLDQIWTTYYVRLGQIRDGHTVPGDSAMLAEPSWTDSLAFVPYSAVAYRAGAAATLSTTRDQALIHQRRALFDLSAGWVAAAPSSAPAMESLALALNLLGDPAALDTLRRARELATSESERVRLRAAELWFDVMHAGVDDPGILRRVVASADSLLRDVTPTAAAARQGLASLLGRVNRAAEMSAQLDTSVGGPSVRALRGDGPALLVFAAFGGPHDSIRSLASRVSAAISSSVLAEERPSVRQSWLFRSARVAFPSDTFPEFRALAADGDALLGADAALLDGRMDSVRGYLDSRARLRKRSAPERVAPEVVYPEARLSLLIGDTTRALAMLDPMLEAVRQMDPHVLSRPVNAATFVRAAALRAELAAGAGDAARARRWATVVATLWSGADPFLQPVVHRMALLRTARPPTSTRH